MDNSDTALMVRFYKRELEIPFKSEQEGRPILQMVDFVRIEVPGDRLNVIDTIVDLGHKKRFGQHWAAYQAEQQTDHIEGTLLTQVPFLTQASAMELRHFKFYTVEQGSVASDAQLANIGASIGMSGFAFREKCKAYLENAKDSAAATRLARELQEMKDLFSAQQKQIAELVSEKQPKDDAPKRGRPAKATAETE
jgi:hypothetical protein